MTKPSGIADKLVLGTAQFGIPYGATNAAGKVAERDVAAIVALAARSGLDCIDTAAGYGASEAVLGAILPDFPGMRVITKLPTIGEDFDAARTTLKKSLELLRRDCLDYLLLHDTVDIWGPKSRKVVELLQSFKRDGVVKRIGVSVYDADDIDAVLNVFVPDIVQIPLNLFDQRLVESGHIRKLAEIGVEIHARSIFLQGILLAEPAAFPEYFSTFGEPFKRYEAFLSHNRLTRLQACLGFVQQSGVNRIVVGVTGVNELREILSQDEGLAMPPMRSLASDDLGLIDPRRWVLAPGEKVLAR